MPQNEAVMRCSMKSPLGANSEFHFHSDGLSDVTRRALAYLHDRGAHFVLLVDKKPLGIKQMLRH
jgi:hypothetical protein